MIRKLLVCSALSLYVGVIASPALAVVKHTGPTKTKTVSYNNSHYEEPKPEVEISRTEPSHPPIITVRVEFNGTCLQMIHVPTGNTLWEFCF